MRRTFFSSSTGDASSDGPIKPSLKTSQSFSSRDRRGRNSLFADSESDDDGADGGRRGSEPQQNAGGGGLTETHHARLRLASSSSNGASLVVDKRDSTGTERKGLFEHDDDTDSLENFRQRVKIRQQERKSEMENLRAELERTQLQLRETEAKLAQESREKDVASIRMDECQRIIEKRNKQLMKASEKMARLTEQAESQINALNETVTKLTADLAAAHAANARDALERQQQFEAAQKAGAKEFAVERQQLVDEYERKLLELTSHNNDLEERARRLQDELDGEAGRVKDSTEYQILLKRTEDAEAIGRGLRFQLQKEQNEKRYLKKQMSALSVQGGTSVETAPLFVDTSQRAELSPSSRSSIASADLSNFDFYPSESPLFAHQPPAAPPAPVSLVDLSQAAPQTNTREEDDATESAPEEHEGVSAASAAEAEVEAASAPTSSSGEPTKAPSRTSSVNFFEKISIRFTRGNSTTKNEDKAPASAGSVTSVASSAPAVLNERPRMYVAKPPSTYDESSDSILGSESSESSDSSDEEEHDEPPPLPPIASIVPPLPSEPTGHVVVPPPEPMVDSDDADSSESSDSEDEKAHVSASSDTASKSKTDTKARAHTTIKTSLSSSKTEANPRQSAVSSSDSESRSDAETKKKPTKRESSVPRRPSKLAESARSSSDSSSSSDDEQSKTKTRRRRHDTEDLGHTASSSRTRKTRDKSRSADGDADDAAGSSSYASRMNAYMEERARRRLLKQKKKEQEENAENKQQAEYEKEWEKLAQEERERKKKQQHQRRKRRPSSMKTVRVSQMKQQLHKQQQEQIQRQQQQQQQSSSGTRDDEVDDPQRRGSRKVDTSSSGSDLSDHDDDASDDEQSYPPPLPPQPTEADAELYARQQARLRERHDLQMMKKREAEEADAVRGEIHRRVEMWAYGKEFLHMILTLDQITTNEALQKCQLMVVQSPDNDTLKKAYRNIIRVIHPDKLRNATIPEQLEAKELFTVLNQAFEVLKNQTSG
ncbi:TPA: hypothetical protein N0F65_010054 [Lagenidium giganteum]|uniref:J domain-containing protein n=1 Tax=Lagenidium giganteum TaxID=4803 RepID=A0AAV2ZI78_9STRA|nr:TPA: hypothetical protein N0F65_010054 [Lagenidium giganteum]